MSNNLRCDGFGTFSASTLESLFKFGKMNLGSNARVGVRNLFYDMIMNSVSALFKDKCSTKALSFAFKKSYGFSLHQMLLATQIDQRL